VKTKNVQQLMGAGILSALMNGGIFAAGWKLPGSNAGRMPALIIYGFSWQAPLVWR
jgi:hypothetical protein